MRLFVRMGLVAALAAGGASSAQPHVRGYAGTSRAGALLLVDGAGKVTSLQVGAGTGYGCVMDRENRLLLVTSAGGSVVRVDPRAGVVVGTLVSGLPGPADVAVDHHGDTYVTGPGVVWRLAPSGLVTTVLRGLGVIDGGLTIDIDSGDLLVQVRSPRPEILKLRRDGSRTLVLGTGGDPRYGIAQDIRTGDVYSGSCCGDFPRPENIYVLRAGTTIATLWLSRVTNPAGVYSLKADRASAARPRLIAGAFHQSSMPGRGGGFYAVDLATRAVTRLTPSLPTLYETEILYRRNVYALADGSGRWRLGVHVPEDPGRAFLVAVSLSGVRPGVALPDGRRLALNPDLLTAVGVAVGLEPFLSRTGGVLDERGRAEIRLDLTALGRAANGLTLWFVAVTFDAAAPGGIRTITDPLVFRVEGI